MYLRFFLIEDDPVVRRMLEKIITDSGLGKVIGQADDGINVSIDQLKNVDVILIDLLMPRLDGIQTMKKLRSEGFPGPFIMISQVENKEMVGEAYLQGVDTYIQKPINKYEVVSVLKRVANHLALSSSLISIRNLLEVMDDKDQQPFLKASTYSAKHSIEEKACHLLLTLGIAGETGTSDILAVIKWLEAREQNGKNIHDLPQLKDLYKQILLQSGNHFDEESLQKELRAMEQRIRRIVLQTFTNLASIGLTDYTNPNFEHYAPRLFDFEEIRQRMEELKNGEKTTKCRLSIKKFITALYLETKEEMNFH
ncbi:MULTISPECIES: response regulator [Aeribacillus]|uniref:Response regulator n=1 Tax=Aeribacillus composti TaxID=1868734 RepID=A0ABY9WF72_9BACI|nr:MULTISPECIES: response regulator [Aeribacillus]RZI51040.1 response regulator [Aeribacillus pallidus]WNF34826.1 response regulator [Aeribacillus composti]BBU38020.1 transcriptional regulator [Aeribacillus pallidus]